ncbi:hypothetical protein [Hyphococcus sp.]|uniref:hypothetical protein n=1 Tax=Hyphococcus sp. TaxID=2038636 RepID=UPI0035C76F1B
MIKKTLFAFIFASSFIASAASAGDVADFCGAVITEMGMEDANGGCTCFEDSLSEEDKSLYLSLENEDDWNARASDDMKGAMAACFPAS